MHLDQRPGFLKIFRDGTAEQQAEAEVRELNETLEARVLARTAELTQAQEALRQSQKMEAMGQLTGGVAHDFNNLLTPIVGSLDLLQRRGLGNEREQRLIEGALQSAERAKTLVQRLLAFARRQPLQPTGSTWASWCRAWPTWSPARPGPRVRVEVDIEPGSARRADRPEPARDGDPQPGGERPRRDGARRDADHLRACRRGAGRASRPTLPPGCYVRLSVADTGIGMDKATLARAVEPFFSTKGIGKGTGLGLSMVHGLAAQLGGALAIDSKPGAGTTVRAVAAGRRRTERACRRDRPRCPRHCGGDGAAGRRRGAGADQHRRHARRPWLCRGRGGVRAKRRWPCSNRGCEPDILVTDHLMPGMTGAELVREVRSRQPKLPVLLVSGYAEAEDVAPTCRGCRSRSARPTSPNASPQSRVARGLSLGGFSGRGRASA